MDIAGEPDDQLTQVFGHDRRALHLNEPERRLLEVHAHRPAGNRQDDEEPG